MTFQIEWMKQWLKKYDKRCNLGEAKPSYRAKNHNPVQILPPNLYLTIIVAKGAGRNMGPSDNNIIDILKVGKLWIVWMVHKPLW